MSCDNIQNYSSTLDKQLPIVLIGNSVVLANENDKKIKKIKDIIICINNSNDPSLISHINKIKNMLTNIKNNNGKLFYDQAMTYLIDDNFNNLLISATNFLSRITTPTTIPSQPTGGRFIKRKTNKRKTNKRKKLKRKNSRRRRQ
jgi:hypothetical protein